MSFIVASPTWQETLAAVIGPSLLLLWYFWARRPALLGGAAFLAVAIGLHGVVIDTIRCGALVPPRDSWGFGINLCIASIAGVILINATRTRR